MDWERDFEHCSFVPKSIPFHILHGNLAFSGGKACFKSQAYFPNTKQSQYHHPGPWNPLVEK